MTKNILKNIVVAQTDPDWYNYLEANRLNDFANFWFPSFKKINHIEQGSLLLFKLLKTKSKIAGWGTYLRSESLSVEDAWKNFFKNNGVNSISEFKIKTRKERITDIISCNAILTNVTFLKKEDWFDCPGWKPNSQNPIKYYPMEDEFGIELRKKILMSAYENSCAITREKRDTILETTDIIPETTEEIKDFSDQIVFRADINKLYDKGLVSVTPDSVFHVSSEIEKSNSIHDLHEDYAGKKIHIPSTGILKPNKEYLLWHYNNRFQR